MRLGQVAVLRELRATGQPVFRSDSGELMALPGGVLVLLQSDTDPAELLAPEGVAPGRIQPLGGLPDAWVVQTEPGLASLELANRLAELEEVLLSQPNWWRDRRARVARPVR